MIAFSMAIFIGEDVIDARHSAISKGFLLWVWLWIPLPFPTSFWPRARFPPRRNPQLGNLSATEGDERRKTFSFIIISNFRNKSSYHYFIHLFNTKPFSYWRIFVDFWRIRCKTLSLSSSSSSFPWNSCHRLPLLSACEKRRDWIHSKPIPRSFSESHRLGNDRRPKGNYVSRP